MYFTFLRMHCHFKHLKLVYLFISISVTTVVFYYCVFNGDYFSSTAEYSLFYKRDQNSSDYWIRTKKQAPCHKWIISMSAREPTPQLKTLNDAMHGWCLLVVGDSATPSNWSYKDAIYLSVRQQDDLSHQFEVIKSIPMTSYKRKMIGYLYAISKGAQFIFETDDNVFLFDGLYRFKYERFNGLVASAIDTRVIFEPFDSHFKSQQSFPHYLYSSLENIPIIQQGLVTANLDNYDTNSPSLVLDHNHLAVLDSRNTLFHYKAFWSLMMPLESDNWELIRSFITMRLLNEIDERVAFVWTKTISNSTKLLNKNNDLKENLLFSLNGWSCKYKEFSSCILSCVKRLAKEGFLNKSEVSFYEQWIKSLNILGFKWPTMKTAKRKSNFTIYYKKASKSNLNEFGQLQAKILNKNCNIVKIKNSYLMDTLILVTFASDQNDLKKAISNFNSFFIYMIVCYNGLEEPLHKHLDLTSFNIVIIPIKNDKGLKYKECLEKAYGIGFRQQSFLIVNHNFDYWNYDLARITFNRVFYSLDLDRSLHHHNVYFIRKNVASSLRKIKLEKISSFESICDYLKSREGSSLTFLEGFKKSLLKLNFHSNDLASEYCENLKTRTIWIPDFHDGPRVDISSTLVHLGMKPILANPKYYMSPYPEALQLSQISHSLSNFIKQYAPFARSVNLSAFRENFEYYKNLAQFEQVDAVICAFTVSLCEAYMSLNKTIILNPAHRYNIGRCSQKSWKKLNENYFTLLKKQRGVVAAMSKYDEEYQAHFTGLRGYRLFAYGGFYAKNVKYNPIRKDILVGPTNYLGPLERSWLKDLNRFAKPHGLRFKHVRDIYPRYMLQDLANHKAVVIFPYASMTYSLVDFYIANIPMFVPSIEIFARYKTIVDRSIKYDPYCGADTIDIEAHNQTIHDYSPNDDSYQPLKYWLKYSDYYQWPFVNVFSSWDELVYKLNNLNLTEISENMKWFNGIKETDLLENWCKVIKQIRKGHIPQSYDDSLAYFNITDFQI